MCDHENEATSSLLNLKDPSSTKDKEMNSTLNLKETSARLFDLHEELSRLHSIICDESISTRKKPSAFVSLGKTIIPFVKVTSIKLLQASKIVSPIPSLKYVHKRDKIKRKKVAGIISESNLLNKKSLPLIRTEKSLHDHIPSTSTRNIRSKRNLLSNIHNNHQFTRKRRNILSNNPNRDALHAYYISLLYSLLESKIAV